MVTGVNTENIPNPIKTPSDGSKVEAVNAVNPSPNLPGDGKPLPHEKPELSNEQQEIESTLREFEQHAQMVQRELRFSIDRDSGKTVIKVMDANTQELVRQIPSDEALRFARKLSEGEKLELFNSFT